PGDGGDQDAEDEAEGHRLDRHLLGYIRHHSHEIRDEDPEDYPHDAAHKAEHTGVQEVEGPDVPGRRPDRLHHPDLGGPLPHRQHHDVGYPDRPDDERYAAYAGEGVLDHAQDLQHR